MSADECKRKQKPRVTGELSSEINERNLNERENRVFVCPICSHCSADISEMEEHGNKQHLDLTNSCEEQKATDLNFDCPICSNDFSNANDLEIHVNSVHEDILTPMKVYYNAVIIFRVMHCVSDLHSRHTILYLQ